MGAYSGWTIEAKADLGTRCALLMALEEDLGVSADSWLKDENGVCWYEHYSYYAEDYVTSCVAKFAQEHPDVIILVTAEYEDGAHARFLYHGEESEYVSEIRTWEQPKRIKWEGSELW